MGPFSASCNDDFTVLGAWLTIAKALAVLGGGLAMFVVLAVVLIVCGRYLFMFADRRDGAGGEE